jgi:hypothetical protein
LIPLRKYILYLVILNVLFYVAGYLLISTGVVVFLFSDLIILSSLFSFISLITYFIFLKGQTKEPDSQTMHSMVSISLKFLFEITLALVWFIVAKKTSFLSVIMFFVIYLTLTLFSLSIILKTLKNKSL